MPTNDRLELTDHDLGDGHVFRSGLLPGNLRWDLQAF